MRQSEDTQVKETNGEPHNGKTGFRIGDVTITPLKLLKFITFFGICLVVALLLVRAMFR